MTTAHRLLAQLRERALRSLRGEDAEVLAAEGDLENLAHRGAVVDGQQGLGHVRLRSAEPRSYLRLCGPATKVSSKCS